MARDLRKSKGMSDDNTNYTADDEKQAKNLLNQFAGKSENELMDQLLSSVSQGKQDGSFNNDMLNDFIKRASPMLTNEQRSKMNDLAKMLKNS